MTNPMPWVRSWSTDPVGRALADRHYNRQKIGSTRFIPPGRCIVLVHQDGGAVWGVSYPFAQYVRHAWAGAWINSIFRNESGDLSSALITSAIAATLCMAREKDWDVPDLGLITFVDDSKTRHKRDPGRCYRKAGFREVGATQSGLVALQLLPADMPAPVEPLTRSAILGGLT